MGKLVGHIALGTLWISQRAAVLSEKQGRPFRQDLLMVLQSIAQPDATASRLEPERRHKKSPRCNAAGTGRIVPGYSTLGNQIASRVKFNAAALS